MKIGQNEYESIVIKTKDDGLIASITDKDIIQAEDSTIDLIPFNRDCSDQTCRDLKQES